MKNIKSSIALLALGITVYSCTKTIEPPLVNSPPQLVIEGAVSDTAGPYHVTISKSVDFYADNTYPGVSGAKVTITDQTAGLSDALTEHQRAIILPIPSLANPVTLTNLRYC
jgi:hypothetical protein